MGHRTRLAAVAILLAASCGSRHQQAVDQPLVWVSPRPLQPLLPRFPTNGDSTALVDLVAMPLGHLFPSAKTCPDHASCRIELKPGRQFANGTPIQGSDLVAAIDRSLHLQPTGGGWHTQAHDALELRLPKPAMSVVPWAAVARKLPDGRWVGSGPYRIKSQTPHRIVLEAVDAKHRPQRVVAESVPGPRAVFSHLLAGRADMATGLPYQHERLLEASGRIGDAVVQWNTEAVLLFNEASPPLAPEWARHCLDQILEPALRRRAERLGLSPSPAIFREASGQPAARGQACSAAIASIGRPLTIEISGIEESRIAAEALLVGLADAGVTTRTRVIPQATLDKPLGADLRLSFINLHHPQGPSLYVATDGRMNVGHHHDPVLDAMLAKGAKWKDISGRLAEDPPFVPLGVLPRVAVTSKRYRFAHPSADATQPFSLALSIRPAERH